MALKVVEPNTPAKADLDEIGQHIKDMYVQRKTDRRDLDKDWDEIDRQLAMEPDPTRMKVWREHVETQWMPITEVPWQAETHELLTADTRRLMWPSSAAWFRAKPDDTDEVLEAFAESLSAQLGVEVEVNAREIAATIEAVHLHFQGLYDFRLQWDLANGDAFAYGHFVTRGRVGELSAFSANFRGVNKPKKIPMLTHIPARSVYLDDQLSAIQHNGMIVKPLHIVERHQRAEDLKLAMAIGKTDPSDEITGGWIKDALDDIETQDKDLTILEVEGDLIVPKSEKSLVFKNVCVDVVSGSCKKGGKIETFAKVYRFRRRALPFSSFIVHHYHKTKSDSAYGMGPLMIGRPLQKHGSESFMRRSQAVILDTEPPMGYDRADPVFAAMGGPRIMPRAKWATTGKIEVYNIGNPEGQSVVYQDTKREYQDATSTNPPRLGQQTKSHQTAFAVDTEIQRSVIRTVDYEQAVEDGPMTSWLHMEAYMMKKIMKKERVYVDEFKQWLDVTGDQIPERCSYEVLGASEPIEENQEDQKRMGALNQLAQADMAAVQLGYKPSDWDKIREYIVKEGFGDGTLFQPRAPASFGGAPAGPAGGPGLPGATGESPDDQLTALATGTQPRGYGA